MLFHKLKCRTTRGITMMIIFFLNLHAVIALYVIRSNISALCLNVLIHFDVIWWVHVGGLLDTFG